MAHEVFQIADPDMERSPYTGMVRRHWMQAAIHLLDAYFAHLDASTGTFCFPTLENGSVVMPRPEDVPAPRRFEAFARIFLLAAPVLREDPRLRLHGTAVAEYFASQFPRFFDPAGAEYAAIEPTGKSPYQLVQWSSIVIALLLNDGVVWSDLPQRTRDQALDHLARAAHHRGNAHNWRYFNLLGYLFLRRQGAAVDRRMERDHLDGILSWYAGDGWYRDGAEFDYYNAWAFQTYAAIWLALDNSLEYEQIARVLRRRLSTFLDTYPRFFSRRGHSLLWGRSSVYRFAAAAPFVAAHFLGDPPVDGGQARRIASGNLLQFLTRPDAFVDGVPTTGFYGFFEPARQYYSGATSFGWMHKLFLCLSLPKSSPFWTEAEHASSWSGLHDTPLVTTLDGPGLTTVNYPRSGATLLVPGKTRFFESEAYTRLGYHSEFLWEANSSAGATAMAYSVLNTETEARFHTREYRYSGSRGGVVYRQAVVADHDAHFSESAFIDLAEFYVAGGLIRVDRIRIPFPYELFLGSFGLPVAGLEEASRRRSTIDGHICLGSEIEDRKFRAAEVWSSGGPSAGKSVAVIALAGWDSADIEEHRGLNAECELSLVPALRRARPVAHRGGIDVCISMHLFTTDGAMLARQPLPVPRSIRIEPISPGSGSPFAVSIETTDGQVVNVDFGHIEGRLEV